jgi:hypothetical protein
MEINWTDGMRNEVLHRVRADRNIVNTVNRTKADRIGHILLRNCFIKLVIEGNIEERIQVKGKRGRGRKQILN